MKHDLERIADLFGEVRATYFPRWDRANAWRVAFGDEDERRESTGYCDSRRKTIYLDRPTILGMTTDGMKAFLIHEICHDVGAASHNRKWVLRMQGAVKVACRIDENEVAEVLEAEIFSYSQPGCLKAYDRSTISEYVNQLPMHYSSDQVLHQVAEYFGYSVAKIRRDYGTFIAEILDDA